MKINFLLPQVTLSGGVKSTFEIANRLVTRGHEVRIIHPLVSMSHGYPFYDIRKTKVRLHESVKNIIVGNKVPWFDVKADLIRVTNFNDSQIPRADISVATWWENVYHVAALSPDKGKKFHIIRAYEIWGGPEKLVNEAYRLPLRKIAISNKLKKIIHDTFSIKDIAVIPNGLNFDIFYDEKKEKENTRQVRIGLLYRRDEIKGMDDALRALDILNSKHNNIALVIFGEKILQPHLEIINKFERCEISGICHGAAVRKIYNSLDIFLFPSREEGFGNPPLEAMACGIATVTTDVGVINDNPEFHEAAIVITPKDWQGLCEGMETLIMDKTKREQTAFKGHEFVQKFSWERSVDSIENLFREALAE